MEHASDTDDPVSLVGEPYGAVIISGVPDAGRVPLGCDSTCFVNHRGTVQVDLERMHLEGTARVTFRPGMGSVGEAIFLDRGRLIASMPLHLDPAWVELRSEGGRLRLAQVGGYTAVPNEDAAEMTLRRVNGVGALEANGGAN